MKLRRTFLIFFSLSVTLFTTAEAVSIKGELKGTGESNYIFLFRIFGPEIYKTDSVKNTNGSFEFRFKENLPRGFYRIGINEERSAVLILGNENLAFKADLDDLPNSISITGSRENEGYEKFRIAGERKNQAVKALDAEAQKVIAVRHLDQEKFNNEIKILQARLDSLNQAENNFNRQLAGQYKGLFFSKVCALFIYSDSTSKNNFLQAINFKDDELTRGDMISLKVNHYLQRYVQPNLDDYKRATEQILPVAPAGSKHREIFYITFIKIFLPYDQAYARNLAVAYHQQYPNSTFAQKYLRLIPKGPPSNGDEAPDLTLTDPEGKLISLSSLKGKVVLLDFWASWCGPCRRENPNVVKAYEKYKDKGFTVFSVSLDNSKDNWVRAIRDDRLSWESHVSDLKGWQSQAAATYGVKGIPATFLIDKDGKVIASNLRGAELESMLERILQ